MHIYFSLLIAGFFGGAVRGFVGFLKHQFSYKNVPFDWKYFTAMSFVSGVIGLMASMATKEIGVEVNGYFSPALGFIIGYAGGDFLEGIYKIIMQKSSLGNGKN
ncbi:MAG: hypothetical protein M1127_01840 [Patescibacteria group bacterium]|nr:hypothetical protein [Patescibacteria group bacterium]